MSSSTPRTEATEDRGSALRELLNTGRLALRLLTDARVPTLTKAIPALALVYVLLPVDLLPDVIPLAGQVDDLAVILIALKLFISMAPEAVVTELEGGAPASDAAIDADYRLRED